MLIDWDKIYGMKIWQTLKWWTGIFIITGIVLGIIYQAQVTEYLNRFVSITIHNFKVRPPH